jgi:hypothetical protein
MPYGTINADVIQSSVSGVSLGAGNATVFKNRIINGDMRIDQRNAGASVTPTNAQYLTDRFSALLTQASKFTAQQNAGSVTPPAGFINYLGMTSSSAYSIGSGDAFGVLQKIEGLNVADLGWGTANAKTITLSFWVRSSLTGTFGGSILNSDVTRSYPFTYTINSANTWEYETITIAGDTSGTWLKTNGIGLNLNFSLGTGATYNGTAGSWAGAYYLSATGATSVVGTNGATFYITGVQLEVGSSATGFEYNDYGRQLIQCQRYTLLLGDGLQGIAPDTVSTFFCPTISPPMRTSPSVSITDTTISISDNYASDFTSSGSTISQLAVSAYGGRIAVYGFTGLTTGRMYAAFNNTNGYFLLLSAEL